MPTSKNPNSTHYLPSIHPEHSLLQPLSKSNPQQKASRTTEKNPDSISSEKPREYSNRIRTFPPCARSVLILRKSLRPSDRSILTTSHNEAHVSFHVECSDASFSIASVALSTHPCTPLTRTPNSLSPKRSSDSRSFQASQIWTSPVRTRACMMRLSDTLQRSHWWTRSRRV